MKDLGSIKGVGLPQAAEARLEQWRLRIRGLHDSVQATEQRLRTVALQANAPAAADEADLTPPPSPSGVTVTAGLSFVFIETDAPQFEQGHGYLRTLVYGAKYLSGDLPTFANAVKVHEFAGNVGSFPSDLGTQWHLWLTWVSSDGVKSSVPAGGTNGHQVTTGRIGTADLGDLIVTAGKLADGSITAGKLAAQAIDATKFANGIEPIALVSAVPGARLTATVFNTSDGKLYRWSGSAYVATVPAADLVGQVGASQIADSAVTTAKFAAGLRPVEIVAALPTSGNFEGRLAYLTTDDKLYRYDGSTWLSTVPAADITGALVATQIADGAVSAIKTTIAAINAATGGLNANTVDAAQLVSNAVSALKIAAGAVTAVKTAIAAIDPSTGNLTANSVTAAQIAAGAVTAAKIAANAIGVNELAAGAVTTGKLAAGAVTTAALAAGAVTANEIAAGTITGAKIAAGAVGTNELAANSITAGKIQAGAIATAQVAAGAITTDKLLVTGAGAALNDDPNFQDASAWVRFTGVAGTFVTIADGFVGTTALQSGPATGGPGTWYNAAKRVPVDPAKTYRVRSRVRNLASGTADGRLYVGVALFDAAGANINGDGGQWFYGAASNVLPPTAWTAYAASFGAGTSRAIPSNARTMAPLVILNYNGTTGAMQAQDLRIEEMASADLIVDGAISTAKLAAGAVTANEIAAGSITGGKIAANTISGANMVAGSIGTNELAANSITAGKIQAGAVTTAQVAAGAITTDKLLVTGRGRALNDDPACSDLSAWSIPQASAAVITGAGAPVGTTVLRATNQTQIISRSFPVEAGKTYKVSLWARQVSGGGVLHVRLYCYNSAGTLISNVVTGITPTSGPLEGLTVPGAWTRYSGFISPGGGSVWAQVLLHVNWATTGVTDVTDLRCEEYVGSDLIVDGSIVASKLAANAIAVGSAAIQNGAIVNAMIANAAIDDAKIAGLSAAKITAGTLDVNRIAAASIDASKINTNGLTIRDASGNVIFGSGAGQPNLSNTGAVALVASANMRVVGGAAEKVSGGSNWDGGVRSVDGYVGGAFASATVGRSDCYVMFGLNTDPAADNSYASIDFAWYAVGDGNCLIYENGAHMGGFGAYAPGDVFTVAYDGSVVRYLRNGAVVRSVVASIAAPLYFDAAFYNEGGRLNNLRFGPYGNPSAVQPSNPITAGNVTTYIANAAIQTLQVADAAITNAKISGDIQSDNFASGSSGWRIRKSDGSAEFAAASIRGKLTTNQLEVGSVTANAVASQSAGGATLANSTAVQVLIPPASNNSLLTLTLNGGFCRVTAIWNGGVGVAKSSTIAFVTCDCSVEMLDESNNVLLAYPSSPYSSQWARASVPIYPNNNSTLINKAATFSFAIQFMFSGVTGVRKFRFVLWNFQGVTTAGAPAAPGTSGVMVGIGTIIAQEHRV